MVGTNLPDTCVVKRCKDPPYLCYRQSIKSDQLSVTYETNEATVEEKEQCTLQFAIRRSKESDQITITHSMLARGENYCVRTYVPKDHFVLTGYLLPTYRCYHDHSLGDPFHSEQNVSA